MDFKNSKMFWFVVSVVLLITIILINANKQSITGNIVEASDKSETTDTVSLEEFAQCLTDKGVKLYGAFWCPHCNNQKQAFKEGLANLTYVECALPEGGQTQACKEAGIRAYPTWIFQNGKRVEGELSLERISQLSGCPLHN